jgi:hypothetical protein
MVAIFEIADIETKIFLGIFENEEIAKEEYMKYSIHKEFKPSITDDELEQNWTKVKKIDCDINQSKNLFL